ncbi:hypothetical protein BDU57DRAFT_509726 [Ampelomyces quisqualis]|uniref:Uncharacterized protein n=1 Tax=Ampelomyces quisqualis TaxID=50730 RepID=A0A6A5R104_AMPQU|nr:hypothetical protein BDU57DRAFT_509726 [Ampelomyces quisqualis]
MVSLRTPPSHSRSSLTQLCNRLTLASVAIFCLLTIYCSSYYKASPRHAQYHASINKLRTRIRDKLQIWTEKFRTACDLHNLRITGSWRIGTNSRIQRARKAFNAYACRSEQHMEAGEVEAEATAECQTSEKHLESSPDRARQIWTEMGEEREQSGPMGRLPIGFVSTRPKRRKASQETGITTQEAAIPVTGDFLPRYQSISEPEIQQVPLPPSSKEIAVPTLPELDSAPRVDSGPSSPQPKILSIPASTVPQSGKRIGSAGYFSAQAGLATRLGASIRTRTRSVPQVERPNSKLNLKLAKANLLESIAQLRQDSSEDDASIIQRMSKSSSEDWLTQTPHPASKGKGRADRKNGGSTGAVQELEQSDQMIEALDEVKRMLQAVGSEGDKAQGAE